MFNVDTDLVIGELYEFTQQDYSKSYLCFNSYVGLYLGVDDKVMSDMCHKFYIFSQNIYWWFAYKYLERSVKRIS